MNKEFKSIFKKIVFYDGVVGTILGGLLLFFSISFTSCLLLGLGAAVLNFFVNSIVVNYSLGNKEKRFNKILMFLGFVFRVSFVCVLALVVLHYSIFGMVIYMLGYSVHFIALLLYGMSINRIERE